MNTLLVQCLLLGERRQRLANLAREFRAGKQDDVGEMILGLAILAGIAAGLWLLARLMERREHRRRVNHPLGLFLALCRAHGLRWSDRWLLWRLANSQKLRDPGRLFLEPERLDPENLDPRWKPHAAQLRLLRQRLFVEPCADSTATGGGLQLTGSAEDSATAPPLDPAWDLAAWLPLANTNDPVQ
jgi:hypothetical protein